MTKQRIEIGIIVAGMILICVLLANQFLWKKKKVSAPVVGAPVGAEVLKAAKPAGEVKLELPPLSESVVKKQKLGLQAPWGRNPFILKSKERTDQPVQESTLSGLSISAILIKGNVGTAIVNGDIVHEGEMLRGCKVVKIDRQGVTLDKGGETVVIPYGK